MTRMIAPLLVLIFFSCKGKDASEQNEEENPLRFTNAFKKVDLPYRLTDTALLENKDTTTIRDNDFSTYIPDSIKTKFFGKNRVIKYTPLAKIEVPDAETYYIVKAVSGAKKAALLLSFDKENQFGATFPFLIPDASAATTQVSSIDKSYSIARSTFQKKPDDVLYEGKDVYVYNNDVKGFTLIMTDVLDESKTELINPIDTLSKKHKWTGDYAKGKRSIVSIRDGRKENTLTFFIHFEKDNGECTGELKGEAQITGSNIALYRQSGDPCVLMLTFSATSVSLSEEEGCGLHRGLECAFEGTFPRKKEPKSKTSEKK